MGRLSEVMGLPLVRAALAQPSGLYEVSVRVVVGELEKDPCQGGAIGHRVVEPAQQRGTALVSVDEERLPQWPVARDRPAHLLTDEFLQCPVAAAGRQLEDVDVVGEVEVGVVHPVVAAAQRILAGHGHLAEDRVAVRDPVLDHLHGTVEVQWLGEGHDPLDHHEVLRGVHVQPQRIDGRHWSFLVAHGRLRVIGFYEQTAL